MKYQIEIIETNSIVETVEAESEAEAMTKIQAAYVNGDIKLTETNAYLDVDFHFV
jgi:hypothetical protein